MRELNVGLAILATWGWGVASAEACHRCCRPVCCCAESVASAVSAQAARAAAPAARAATGGNTLLGDVNAAPLGGGNGGGLGVPPEPNGTRPLTTLLGDVFDDSTGFTPSQPARMSLLGDEVSQATWKNLALWQAKLKPRSPKITFDLRKEALSSAVDGRVVVATDEEVLTVLHDADQIATNWQQ